MSENLKKWLEICISASSSLQELFVELINDECTFDKPTFISIYFYVCA